MFGRQKERLLRRRIVFCEQSKETQMQNAVNECVVIPNTGEVMSQRTHISQYLFYSQNDNLCNYSNVSGQIIFCVSSFLFCDVQIKNFTIYIEEGPGVAQWLRRCAISWAVPGSIPGIVTGFFSDLFLPTLPWPWGRLSSQ